MIPEVTELSLSVAGRGEVSAVSLRPPGCRYFLVLGHGAGAGMHHAFMQTLTEALAERGIGTLRYQFPYMDRGQRRPDPAHVLQTTVRAAVNSAGLLVRDLPLFAGGKSMGGRMTSQAQADRAFHALRGLVFFGFPLHPIGEPGITRADHLRRIGVPMLFLQGRRDRLALPHLLEPVLHDLGPLATVQWLEEGDHEFGVPKRTGMDRKAVAGWLARQTENWMSGIAG